MYDPFNTLDDSPGTEAMFDPELSDIPRGAVDRSGMSYGGVVSDNDPVATARSMTDDLGTGRAGTLTDDLGADRAGTLSEGLGTGGNVLERNGNSNGNGFDPGTYEF